MSSPRAEHGASHRWRSTRCITKFYRQTAAQLGIGNLYPVKGQCVPLPERAAQAVRRDFSDAPDLEGSEQVGETGAGGQPAAPGGDFHLRTLRKNGFLGLRGVLAIKEFGKRTIFSFFKSRKKAFAVLKKLHYLCTRNRPNGALVLVRNTCRNTHGVRSPTHRQQTEGEDPQRQGTGNEAVYDCLVFRFPASHGGADEAKADKGTSTSIREGYACRNKGRAHAGKKVPKDTTPYGSGKGKQ